MIRRIKSKINSFRSVLIKENDKLMFAELIRERGAKCEFCGRTQGLGTFHILRKATYPRIRYHRANLLLACWQPCHYTWHHDYKTARDKIEPKIKELCGEDYEEKLLALNLTAPRLTMTQLNLIKMSLMQ